MSVDYKDNSGGVDFEQFYSSDKCQSLAEDKEIILDRSLSRQSVSNKTDTEPHALELSIISYAVAAQNTSCYGFALFGISEAHGYFTCH